MRRSIEQLSLDGVRGMKFVRLGPDIFVPTNSASGGLEHSRLVVGLLGMVKRLEMSDPAALDAGYLQASPDIQEFRTHGDSGTLGLPLPGFAAQARAGTDARLEELFPGFSVIG